MPTDDPTPKTPIATTGASTQADFLDGEGTPVPAEPEGSVVGERYEIRGEVARGGLGQILLAWDRVLQRPVALKKLLRESGSARRRFDRETQITAALEHPAIVPVHDAGATPEGDRYFAMKLVDGRSLDVAIAERRGLAERLGLLPNVISACEAVAYAHSRGVIHRDLKPDNVLVGAFGETLVIDWGLAKQVGTEEEAVEEGETAASQASGSGSLTRVGSVIGTPAYMPPEQATGQDVDPRADVYALGALLYEVLAGKRPYAGTPPKEVLTRVVAGPPTPLVALEPAVPRDLTAIVSKAMARDPRDRYADAGELVADLRRFQTGQFVGAYHYTPAERLRHVVGRRPVVSGLVALLAVGSMASFGAILSQRNLALERQAEAEQAREQAEAARVRERDRADAVTMEQAVLALDGAPQRSLQLLAQLSEAYADTARVRLVAADALSRGIPRMLGGHRADVHTVSFSEDGRLVATGSLDGTIRVRDSDDLEERYTLPSDGTAIVRVQFLGDALVSSAGPAVRISDGRTGAVRTTLEGHEDLVQEVARAPDGRWATASLDATARIWSAEGEELVVFEGHDLMLYGVDWSPDGTRLVTTSADTGSLRLWADTGEELAVVDGLGDQYGALFSPDGRWIASWGEEPVVTLVDGRTGERVHTLDLGEGWVGRVDFSGDGSLLVASTAAGHVVVFSLPDGERVDAFHGHQTTVNWLDMDATGQRVVSGDDDGVVYVWDRDVGSTRRLPGLERPVREVWLSPDGRQVIAGAAWDAALLWDLDQGGSRVLSGPEGQVRRLCWMGEERLVSVGTDGVRGWDLASGRSERWSEVAAAALDCDPDSGRVVVGSADRTVTLFDEAGEVERQETLGNQVAQVALASDGAWTAAVDRGGEVRVTDASGTAVLREESRVIPFRFELSEDGSRLVLCGVGATRLWDLEKPAEPATVLDAEQSIVTSCRFVDQGLLTAGTDGSVHLWPDARPPSRRLQGFPLNLTVMDVLPDGTALAGDGGGTLTLWTDLEAEPTTLRGHTQYASVVTLSEDGRRAASGAWESTGRLWALDADPPTSRELLGHTDNVVDAVFSPDGRTVATASWDGSIRLWDDSLPTEPSALRAELSRIAAAIEAGEPIGPARGTMAP